jgi:hypothetical protein
VGVGLAAVGVGRGQWQHGMQAGGSEADDRAREGRHIWSQHSYYSFIF